MVSIWSVAHRYFELSGDGELYAMQALAKLHTNLATDIYLQNTSQDRYTVFSWLYAKLIGAVGLHRAGLGLFVTCTAWFLAASWALSRRLAPAGIAWLSVILLMILVGRYGSYGVFRYSEEFLTARSAAEALIVTALACFYGGTRLWAIALAAATLSIHPLMALPGLLLLICLCVGLRASIAGALGGMCLAALLAAVGVWLAQTSGPLVLIDAEWLNVVRERSQFLFLPLWTASDWKGSLLPLVSLALTLLVVPDQRVRQLAWASLLVGSTGLGVALIACTIGPVAILLQGQPWRWMWIPSFASILLLAPTLMWMWRDERCGPVCAILLIASWTCPVVNIWMGLALIVFLWLVRPRISSRVARILRGAALGLGVVLVAWTLANAWTIVHNPAVKFGNDTSTIAVMRNVFGMQTAALLLFAVVWWIIRTTRSLWIPAVACLPLGTMAASTLPGTLETHFTTGSPAEISSFADWRAAIPATANVLVLGVHNSAAFVWFTLDRPDYLSIDQSAGVVFSRATAMEVKRRSEVLEPLVEPSWKIMTDLAKPASIKPVPEDDFERLSAATLPRLCRETQLDFVIARQFVGFDPLRHTRAGPYKDWYLYDCRHVRSLDGSA